MYYIYDNSYLAHHGILRMKWGQRNGPPYPLLRDAAGRLKAKAQAKRKAKSEARAERAVEEKAKEHQALKKYLRNNPEKLYKHRNDLTQEEINEIMAQIEWDRRVKDISTSERQRSINRMLNVLKTGATVAENTRKVYQTLDYFKERKAKKKRDRENNN